MKSFFSCLFLIITAAACIANLPEDPQEYSTWQSKAIATIKSQGNDSPEIAIPKLGSWLYTLSIGMNIEKGDRPVFHTAQETLLSIPGHAKYYQDKIEKMRSEVMANSKKPLQEIIKMQNEGIEVIYEPDYLSETEVALRTLEFMPSAETVSVLGHFLNDPEGRDGKTLLGNPRHRPGDDFPERASNAEVATEVVRALGIEHPPSKEPPSATKITAEEIDAWKDWWNEVKAGKRTYRFIGSKIEYGPDGPASKEAVQRAEGNQKRDEERAAGNKRTTPVADSVPVDIQQSKPLLVAGLIAGSLLCAFAVRHVIKRKPSL